MNPGLHIELNVVAGGAAFFGRNQHYPTAKAKTIPSQRGRIFQHRNALDLVDVDVVKWSNHPVHQRPQGIWPEC